MQARHFWVKRVRRVKRLKGWSVAMVKSRGADERMNYEL
jgi:hypothetical protein